MAKFDASELSETTDFMGNEFQFRQCNYCKKKIKYLVIDDSSNKSCAKCLNLRDGTYEEEQD